MALENVTFINSLNPSNPTGVDKVSEGDDHIRNIKKALVASFPNVDGPVTLTANEFSQLKDLVLNPPETTSAIAASCKYNGANLMYKEGVTSVANGWNGDDGLGPGAYRVYFDSDISEFDQHYAPIITSFPAIVNGVGAYPCVIALQEFQADSVTFTVHQIGGPENGGASQNPVGFSLLIVDMVQR